MMMTNQSPGQNLLFPVQVLGLPSGCCCSRSSEKTCTLTLDLSTALLMMMMAMIMMMMIVAMMMMMMMMTMSRKRTRMWMILTWGDSVNEIICRLLLYLNINNASKNDQNMPWQESSYIHLKIEKQISKLGFYIFHFQVFWQLQKSCYVTQCDWLKLNEIKQAPI